MKWAMIHHIAVPARKDRRRYAAVFAEIDLPKIGLPSVQAIEGFYRAENLRRA